MAKLTLIAATSALLALTACNGVDYDQTAKDAVAGAVVGAGANYIINEDVAQGALIGAAGGAAVSQIK